MFQVHAAGTNGGVILYTKLSRGHLISFFTKLLKCSSGKASGSVSAEFVELIMHQTRVDAEHRSYSPRATGPIHDRAH